jgi:hypothetical protein
MRMVVDLPAPLLPRNPKISPARTSKETVVDGDEIAESARQVPDLRWRSSSDRSGESGFGEPDARKRPRSIELGLQ